MKTPEEMREFFRSMPSKKKENPYWEFDDEAKAIKAKSTGDVGTEALHLNDSENTLLMVREYFRRFYDAFQTEAQVLCVTRGDGEKLNLAGIPILGHGQIGPYAVTVMVLPQDNHMGTTVLSEGQWQGLLVDHGITPVLRIHSHHVLEPYQSMTDYSTLNSGTLEMVIGRIYDNNLSLCYWLDVPGTDLKAQTFVVRQVDGEGFDTEPKIFNRPISHIPFPTGRQIGKITPEGLSRQAHICAETFKQFPGQSL